ncbi:Na+/H+ antiporter NhaA [Desulfococcaceae bacterium HSG9]|nr:Na+/H+ antiporter NhaA [Desulfococcaceae bacterium HSG9]
MAHSNEIDSLWPKAPIDTLIDPFKRFLHIESAGGIALLIATVVALVLANSSVADWYLALWKTKVGFTLGSFQMIHSLQHWINDGLMAVFFFVVGLEVKREIVMGELQDIRQAALPLAAAVGGMAVPAGIYLLLQYDSPGVLGWGIPMATDIAFVVGILAVLGSRISNSLRVMLLSLAIADDIGAILVIAVGYSAGLNYGALAFAIAGILVMLVFMKVGVRNVGIYIFLMIMVWFGFHESGIHATIAGVICGLMTPARSWLNEGVLSDIVNRTRIFVQGGGWQNTDAKNAALRMMEVASRKSISPLERFETGLHPWVGFVIMPVFALANAGVPINAADFTDPVATAVAASLIIGKPAGIILFSWLIIKTGIARMPAGISWGAIAGGGTLAGVGFTMAIFIASLALECPQLDAAKVGVLAGSALCASAGAVILIITLPKPTHE